MTKTNETIYFDLTLFVWYSEESDAQDDQLNIGTYSIPTSELSDISTLSIRDYIYEHLDLFFDTSVITDVKKSDKFRFCKTPHLVMDYIEIDDAIDTDNNSLYSYIFINNIRFL